MPAYLLVLLAAAVPLLAGCRSLTGRGPVPKAVAECRLLSQQGIAAMQSGEWNRAEDLLGSAVQACPQNTEARRQYAEALWSRGSLEAAVAQLEAALAVETEDPSLYVRAGEMYLELGQLERAQRNAEHALYLENSFGDAWALRGRIMRTAGDSRQALADLHRALNYQPENAGVLLEIAHTHRQRGQPERALAALQRLADLYPPGEEPEQVPSQMAMAYFALNRHQDARQCLLAAARSHRGGGARLYYELAQLELATGRVDAARQAAQLALAASPTHSGSQALLERLRLAQAGRPVQ